MSPTQSDRRPASSAVHRRWASSVREEAIRRTSSATREACRTFDVELTERQRINAVQEIVETRTSELCWAYHGVIDVSFGFRLRRNRNGKQQRIVPQPCVRFLVETKWNAEDARTRKDAIPPRLLTYCTIGSQRRLCAVPTDVEDSVLHASARAHGTPRGITVEWKETTMSGMIACAVERNRLNGKLFAIGCRHVLSLSEWLLPEKPWGATVRIEGEGGALIGVTRAIAGVLDEAPVRSFDAQLFEVTDRQALQQTMEGPACTRYAQSMTDIPDTYDIHTPHGVCRARFVERIERGRPLYRIGNVWIAHDVPLIRSQPSPSTRDGDSGSPVISCDGETLLGMHVAGIDGTDTNGVYTVAAYMVPAWALLDPVHYTGVGTEIWALASP